MDKLAKEKLHTNFVTLAKHLLPFISEEKCNDALVKEIIQEHEAYQLELKWLMDDCNHLLDAIQLMSGDEEKLVVKSSDVNVGGRDEVQVKEEKAMTGVQTHETRLLMTKTKKMKKSGQKRKLCVKKQKKGGVVYKHHKTQMAGGPSTSMTRYTVRNHFLFVQQKESDFGTGFWTFLSFFLPLLLLKIMFVLGVALFSSPECIEKSFLFSML
ncbi:hypothetical protein HMI54_009449 [Coelomomyces lativittatus]|nr:hypothetical protein HMI54_009449 [Coelomomyces lativittatus]